LTKIQEIQSGRERGDPCHKGGIGASTGVEMTDRPKDPERDRREQRLAVALRENLKRRKAQARGRATGTAVDRADPTPHDSAEIAADKHKS
jgi:hypothetical protein